MKEWTIMFYLAGDNALAPLVVSQIKAIKDAGFQENIDVLVHFDPNELGVPTRIFDVNRDRKQRLKTRIGDGRDPFVRNLIEDKIPEQKKSRDDKSKSTEETPENPDAINAEDALAKFLSFCCDNHQAKHYILFLVGHGLVVGNDAFLPDDNPVSAITLKKLGKILNDFTADAKGQGGAFELLFLHSCSMSAIEVAYQLKDTAKYMIASEGPEFIDSYPYRQLLKKVFNTLEEVKEARRQKAEKKGGKPDAAASNPRIDISRLVEKLYFLTLHNATDFLLAGYSHDLALCSLDSKKYTGLTTAIRQLVAQLTEGLKESNDKVGAPATERGKRIKELVLLAHWEAQSYWGESYTDLFDFCQCLGKRCDSKDLARLKKACSNVIDQLKPIKSAKRAERFQALVIHSDNFGSTSQYSHGLSIYFPWSRPVEVLPKRNPCAGTGGGKRYEDEEKEILERYAEYAFTIDLGDHPWLNFLKTYFDETKRRLRREEENEAVKSSQALAEARASFNPIGVLSGDKPLPSLDKPAPSLDKSAPSIGGACGCASIKNYPTESPDDELKRVHGKTVKNAKAFAITEGALGAFNKQIKSK